MTETYEKAKKQVQLAKELKEKELKTRLNASAATMTFPDHIKPAIFDKFYPFQSFIVARNLARSPGIQQVNISDPSADRLDFFREHQNRYYPVKVPGLIDIIEYKKIDPQFKMPMRASASNRSYSRLPALFEDEVLSSKLVIASATKEGFKVIMSGDRDSDVIDIPGGKRKVFMETGCLEPTYYTAVREFYEEVNDARKYGEYIRNARGYVKYLSAGKVAIYVIHIPDILMPPVGLDVARKHGEITSVNISPDGVVEIPSMPGIRPLSLEVLQHIAELEMTYMAITSDPMKQDFFF